MKFSELKRLLKKNGCYMLMQGKRHEIWKSNITGEEFPIGRHNTEEVPTGTLKSILRSAGLK